MSFARVTDDIVFVGMPDGTVQVRKRGEAPDTDGPCEIRGVLELDYCPVPLALAPEDTEGVWW